MKTHLVRIGNSRGIRLPKPIIEEAGLTDEVEVRVREGAIIIAPSAAPRSGWAKAAKRLRERDEDRLLNAPNPTPPVLPSASRLRESIMRGNR